MKICILTSGHKPFDDRIFYKEALSLRTRYDDVTIIAPYEKDLEVVDGIRIIGVGKGGRRWQLVRTIFEKALEQKADIYHIHDYELLFIIPFLKRRLSHSRIIYDAHEHYPDMVKASHKIPGYIKGIMSVLVDKMEVFLGRSADYILTADDAVKARCRAFNPNVEVIYNFPRLELFLSAEGIDKYTRPTVIYEGGIARVRGVMELVEATDIVRRKVKDVRMLFVGPFDDERCKAEVTDYIERNRLGGNIEFLGTVPHVDVPAYIRRSHIGAVTLLPIPKFYKNIPIKQFEYMACGVPIIGSNLPPITSFVKESGAGLIVDPTKPEEIAQAMLYLIEHDEEARIMGSNGEKAVKERYNWAKMEDRLLGIYAKLGG